jgi:hypothetical protein|tara:strand:- start:225 stop:410 length:186 start_codon:yes stop_codon:yes gene_type:complete
MYKVHWIIDGVAEIEKKNQDDAEAAIKEKIEKFVQENSDFFKNMGAIAIQGKAYLPGKDDK